MMKYLLLSLIFFSCVLVSLQAQQTFSITPNPVVGEYVDGYINEGRATIKNITSNTYNFRWKRTVIRLDHDSTCYTAISDPYTHWIETASEKNFVLQPGQEGPLYVTLYDFEQAGCCAIVQIKIKNLDIPTDSIEAYYYLRECQPLEVSEIQKASVQIFPNPATQYFSLQNAESVNRLSVYSADGKLHKQMQANAENHYGIVDLPLGTYFLVLENKVGSVLQVMEFVRE